MLEVGKFPASRIMVLAYGIQCAFLGAMHGYLEILHGNAPTGGLVIDANSHIANSFFAGTEPALTVVPNFLFTGILAVAIGFVILVVCASLAGAKYSGWVLIGLSLLLMLSGGGFTPIPFGILAGVSGIGLRVFSRREGHHRGFRASRRIAALWLPLFCISIAWYFYLDFLGYMFRMESTVTGLVGLMICVLAVISGFFRDSQPRPVLGI